MQLRLEPAKILKHETLNAVDRISNTRIMMSGELPAVRWHGNP